MKDTKMNVCCIVRMWQASSSNAANVIALHEYPVRFELIKLKKIDLCDSLNNAMEIANEKQSMLFIKPKSK